MLKAFEINRKHANSKKPSKNVLILKKKHNFKIQIILSFLQNLDIKLSADRPTEIKSLSYILKIIKT